MPGNRETDLQGKAQGRASCHTFDRCQAKTAVTGTMEKMQMIGTPMVSIIFLFIWKAKADPKCKICQSVNL